MVTIISTTSVAGACCSGQHGHFPRHNNVSIHTTNTTCTTGSQILLTPRLSHPSPYQHLTPSHATCYTVSSHLRPRLDLDLTGVAAARLMFHSRPNGEKPSLHATLRPELSSSGGRQSHSALQDIHRLLACPPSPACGNHQTNQASVSRYSE